MPVISRMLLQRLLCCGGRDEELELGKLKLRQLHKNVRELNKDIETKLKELKKKEEREKKQEKKGKQEVEEEKKQELSQEILVERREELNKLKFRRDEIQNRIEHEQKHGWGPGEEFDYRDPTDPSSSVRLFPEEIKGAKGVKPVRNMKKQKMLVNIQREMNQLRRTFSELENQYMVQHETFSNVDAVVLPMEEVKVMKRLDLKCESPDEQRTKKHLTVSWRREEPLSEQESEIERIWMEIKMDSNNWEKRQVDKRQLQEIRMREEQKEIIRVIERRKFKEMEEFQKNMKRRHKELLMEEKLQKQEVKKLQQKQKMLERESKLRDEKQSEREAELKETIEKLREESEQENEKREIKLRQKEQRMSAQLQKMKRSLKKEHREMKKEMEERFQITIQKSERKDKQRIKEIQRELQEKETFHIFTQKSPGRITKKESSKKNQGKTTVQPGRSLNAPVLIKVQARSVTPDPPKYESSQCSGSASEKEAEEKLEDDIHNTTDVEKISCEEAGTEEPKFKSTMGHVVGWGNEKMRDRYKRKMEKSLRREKENENKSNVICTGEIVQDIRVAKVEQKKRRRLDKQEKRRQELEGHLGGEKESKKKAKKEKKKKKSLSQTDQASLSEEPQKESQEATEHPDSASVEPSLFIPECKARLIFVQPFNPTESHQCREFLYTDPEHDGAYSGERTMSLVRRRTVKF